MASPPARVVSFAIVPAAGHSRRMGRPKLLLPWGERTVMEQVLTAWRASRVDHVLVVCRPADEALQAVCRRAGAEVIVPAEPPTEMKDSVRIALAYAERQYAAGENDVWLLAPADMPGLAPRVIDRLLAAHDPAHLRILAPQVAGRRGHPVLFPWPLAAEVAQLRDDQGVNELTKRYPVHEIPVDEPGILQDLDTPEDYLDWGHPSV